MIRLTLLLILALYARVHAQSPKLIVAGPPQPTEIEGYFKAHCVALHNRIRICKVLTESDSLLLVEKDGKTVGTWRVDADLGETEHFHVMRGDLDGDRKPELIVANLDSTSTGIGVSVWSLLIFPDSEFRSFPPPLTFRIKEFGTHGTVVSTGRTLSILTTDWVWGNDPRGRRGQGLYLVGQWWRYHGGELQPLPKPIGARRYLFSFSNERFATLDSDRIPYRWLSERRAERVSTDFITGPVSSSKRGVIESVSVSGQDSPQRFVKIAFKPNGGQTSEFVYGDENENGLNADRFIGDTASGRVYPDHYLPTNLKKWLTGRRATLRTYTDRKAEILWLEPRKGKN
jgi:hypothetical protein